MRSPRYLNGGTRSPFPAERDTLNLTTASFSALLLLAAVAAWLTRRQTHSRADLRERQLIANSSENAAEGGAISPDGKYLAYIDPKGMHIKLLETGEMHTVPEPEAVKDTRVDWDIRPWSNTKFVATAFIPGRPIAHGWFR